MRFSIEIAKRGQAACKYGKCKQKIEKGVLRIGKISPSPFSEGAELTQWFHANCLFEQMKNPRAMKLESIDDLEGLDEIPDSDKQLIQDLFQKQNEAPSGSGTSTPSGTPARRTPKKKAKSGESDHSADEATPKKKKQKKGDGEKPARGRKKKVAHSDEGDD